MFTVKKYIEKYSSDIFGYFGAALIGASIGLAICKLV
tara:strand:+ start:537 stop:647 length:111 start_codon:yes stop_codon:yes gene_type:complete